MDTLDKILKMMENDPWKVKLKRRLRIWRSIEISNRLSRFRVWLHKNQMKETTCKDCKHFIGFVFYVDKGDCMHLEVWDIVNVWNKKCSKFESVQVT